MTHEEFARRAGRVELLCALLADEFDVGFAEMSRLKRAVKKFPARYRELMQFLLAADREHVTCRKCHGSGTVRQARILQHQARR